MDLLADRSNACPSGEVKCFLPGAFGCHDSLTRGLDWGGGVNKQKKPKAGCRRRGGGGEGVNEHKKPKAGCRTQGGGLGLTLPALMHRLSPQLGLD